MIEKKQNKLKHESGEVVSSQKSTTTTTTTGRRPRRVLPWQLAPYFTMVTTHLPDKHFELYLGHPDELFCSPLHKLERHVRRSGVRVNVKTGPRMNI